MGYSLATDRENAAPACSHVGPKTHTPLLRVKERGSRSYSPGLGRWVNRDPAEESLGGLNLHGFLRNAPTLGVDLLGLASASQVITLFAAKDNWYNPGMSSPPPGGVAQNAREVNFFTRVTINALPSGPANDAFGVVLEIERPNSSPTITGLPIPTDPRADWNARVTGLWSPPGSVSGWLYGNIAYWTKNGGIAAIADWSDDSVSLTGWDNSKQADTGYVFTHDWSGSSGNREVLVHLAKTPQLKLTSDGKNGCCLKGKLTLRVVLDATNYTAGKVGGPIVFRWTKGNPATCGVPVYDAEESAASSTITKNMAWAATTYNASQFNAQYWPHLANYGWLP
jgi:RHS repeat-associated protein